MTNTRTTATKTNHYLRALVTLALVASLLALIAVRPAHADGEWIFKVNNTFDYADISPGDGVCDVDFANGNACTLRAAIQETNATPELDAIHFDIPEAFRDPNSGVATISPAKELPTITEPVVIDGYSQPGASVNTAARGTNAAPKIVLSGAKIASFAQDVDGLSVIGGGTTIKGLVINGFKADDQTFSGGTGIFLANVAGNTGNVIAGNFVGTDAAGTGSVGNQTGGIVMAGASTNNTIGGTALADRNLISGNGLSGIQLTSNNNTVQNNLIGTDKSGTKDLGNAIFGVGVFFSSNNLIGGASPNTIAFNGNDGVSVSGSALNTAANGVLSNSIFSNGALGIDLVGGFEDAQGNTANEPGDVDTGPNGLQNKPLVSSAKTSTTATTIQGNLTSTPNKTFVVRFYSNPAGTDEGKTFVGQKSVSTDGSGKATFTKALLSKVSVGKAVTATATSPGGETSEFSAPRTVASS